MPMRILAVFDNGNELYESVFTIEYKDDVDESILLESIAKACRIWCFSVHWVLKEVKLVDDSCID